MKSQLSVSAIAKGTVIDHIPAGNALKIMSLLGVKQHLEPVTVGLNLPSQRLQRKDIIKIENRFLTIEEIDQLGVFAARATLNVIENYSIIKKSTVNTPESVKAVFACPNPRCISTKEKIETYFKVHDIGVRLELQCKYCERTYTNEVLMDNND